MSNSSNEETTISWNEEAILVKKIDWALSRELTIIGVYLAFILGIKDIAIKQILILKTGVFFSIVLVTYFVLTSFVEYHRTILNCQQKLDDINKLWNYKYRIQDRKNMRLIQKIFFSRYKESIYFIKRKGMINLAYILSLFIITIAIFQLDIEIFYMWFLFSTFFISIKIIDLGPP